MSTTAPTHILLCTPPSPDPPPIGHHTPNSHTPLEFSRNVSLRCYIHNIDMNSIRGMVHCEDCESDFTEGFAAWSKLVLFLCICFLLFSSSKCIKCIKRKRLQVDFFYLDFFCWAHCESPTLDIQYSNCLILYCHCFLIYIVCFFYVVLYDFSLGNWKLDVWNTSGVFSVCNIVVKCFRKEKKRKKNVLKHPSYDFPLTDGVIDFYITTQALLISHCISWRRCLMLNVKGQSTDVGGTRSTIAFISASLQKRLTKWTFQCARTQDNKGKGFSYGLPLCSDVLTFSHFAESPFMKVSIKVDSSLLLS